MRTSYFNVFTITTIVVYTFVAFLPTTYANERDDALAAHMEGDYVTAFNKFKVLAEQGDAIAQTELGLMYLEGQATPQDFNKAMHWFRKSAKQGDAGGQNGLGVIYYYGSGWIVYVLQILTRKSAEWHHRSPGAG